MVSDPTTGYVRDLYRFPVKGLSAERLNQVEARVGETLPFDRSYAIENGPGRFDPDAPRHLPKVTFLMLMRDERLATLETRFDDQDQVLTICRNGKQVARGQLTTRIGRQMIEQFLAAYLKSELRGAPRIVSANGHSFSDVAAKCLHIVNMASARQLERVLGRPIDPLRFRPNMVLDGLAPWAEFNWIGHELRVGDVRLKPFKRTQRCAATNVDPATGARDLAIPATLQREWGHDDFGIYAEVTASGTLRCGADIEVAAGPSYSIASTVSQGR